MDKLGLVLLIFAFVAAVVGALDWLDKGKATCISLAFLTAAMIFGNVGTIFK